MRSNRYADVDLLPIYIPRFYTLYNLKDYILGQSTTAPKIDCEIDDLRIEDEEYDLLEADNQTMEDYEIDHGT